MNLIDVLKNPLPMIALAGVIFLAIYVLSEKNASKKVVKSQHNRDTSFYKYLTPISRKAVFTLSLAWAVGIFIYAAYAFNEVDPSVTFMARMYGLSALFGLYLVLLIGLTRVYFPKLSINGLLLHASRGFGLSTFLFVCLHVLSAFFANLDGKLNALSFLSVRHQIALSFSSVAFIILLLMASTSVDRVIAWMGFSRWKKLHRFVHLAVILILFHAFLIGSHLTVVAAPLPLIIIGASLTILFLEVGAIYKKMHQKIENKDTLSFKLASVGLVVLLCGGMLAASLALRSSYDPHAGHSMSYNDQYNIEVIPVPSDFSASQTINLRIRVTDKATSQPWTTYNIINEKLLHLIAISEDMQQYEHLHPDYVGDGEFSVSYTPPQESSYYLYAEFAPTQDTEALASTVIRTKGAPAPGAVPRLISDERVQSDDRYTVTLNSAETFRTGQQYSMQFTIADSATKNTITNFEPYLGVLGHLAIIHENKQDYLHVHPTLATTAVKSGDTQSIDFSAQFPRPGMYRLYLQFKYEGRLQTAAFTVEVQ